MRQVQKLGTGICKQSKETILQRQKYNYERHAETYSEHSQTSKTEFFCENLVNDVKPLTIFHTQKTS